MERNLQRFKEINYKYDLLLDRMWFKYSKMLISQEHKFFFKKNQRQKSRVNSIELMSKFQRLHHNI